MLALHMLLHNPQLRPTVKELRMFFTFFFTIIIVVAVLIGFSAYISASYAQVSPANSPPEPVTPVQAQDDDTQYLRNLIAKGHPSGTVTIPAGHYYISGPLVEFTKAKANKLNLRGEGIGRTVIHCMRDVDEPIIAYSGNPAFKDPYESIGWFSVDDLEFDGMGNKVTWLSLDFVAHAYFTRCYWRNTTRTAVQGTQWWDSTFCECHWTQCGSTGYPAVHAYLWQTDEGSCSCNNLCFNTCRWENCPAVGFASQGYASTKNRFVSCKFDRVGTCFSFSNTRPQIITACQFTKVGYGVKAVGCKGLIITDSVFEEHDIGVSLNDCDWCVVSDNTFNIMQMLPGSVNIEVMKFRSNHKISNLGR